MAIEDTDAKGSDALNCRHWLETKDGKQLVGHDFHLNKLTINTVSLPATNLLSRYSWIYFRFNDLLMYHSPQVSYNCSSKSEQTHHMFHVYHKGHNFCSKFPIPLHRRLWGEFVRVQELLVGSVAVHFATSVDTETWRCLVFFVQEFPAPKNKRMEQSHYALKTVYINTFNDEQWIIL